MDRQTDMPVAPRIPPSGKAARARRLSLTGLAVVFALVCCGTWCGFPPDVRLGGVERRVAGPHLTARTWLDGTFAAAVEPWLVQNLGWRGIGIRTANQINTTLFRRQPGGAHSSVITGLDGWLFEKAYVRERTRRPAFRAGGVEAFAAELARLQQRCRQRGMAFAVLIAPSKAEIYPEYLPKPMQRVSPDVEAQSNAYQQLVAALQGTDVVCVDTHAAFLEWKREGADLFARGGIHWNHYGAQRVLERVWQALREEPAARALPVLPAVAGYRLRPPGGTDNDLARLLNLWTVGSARRRPVPFPVLDATPVNDDAPLRIAIAGDSFAFTLIDALARTGIRGEVDFFFYCRHHYQVRLTGERRDLASRTDLGEIGFDAVVAHPRLADADILLLAFNEIYTRTCGWGLPAALVAAADDTEVVPPSVETPGLGEPGGSGSVPTAVPAADKEEERP